MNPQQRRVFAIILATIMILGVLGALAAPLLAEPARRSAPDGSTLEPWSQVAGTDGRQYIADQDGRALQFHGMNIKTDHPATDVSDDVLADGRARGFDLLRLSIYWDTFEPTDDQWNEAYFAEIATAMDRAQAHGFWVILDMHQDGFNQKFGGRGFPDWVTEDDGLPFTPQDSWLLNSIQPGTMRAWQNLYETPAFRAAQIDAWEEVVQRFGHHPALLGYDLLNEPFGELRSGEPLPAAIERVETTQITPMYQRETTAIRALDPQHWVFIEPPNQASLGIRTWLGPISGGRIAFFPHLYDSAIETATYTPGGVVKFDPTFFDTYGKVIDTYPRAHHVPMLFGEWGVAHPEAKGMDQYIAGVLDLMDRHGSGWTMFNGCRGEGYCPFDANGNDRPGIGQIVEPYAKAIAGSPTSFDWDPAARTLTVVFRDGGASGLTDLVIPTSRYPEGWVVETSDPDGTSAPTAGAATAGVDRVSVDTAGRGDAVAICVKPKGAPSGCKVPLAAPATTTTTTSVPAGTAPGAQPVAGQAGYTG